MYIKTISISNFRCFGETPTVINLDSKVVGFVGSNGSGKTSILDALNFVLGQDYLPTRISEKDFNIEAKDLKDEIRIECETSEPFFNTLETRSSTNQLETIMFPCNKILLTVKRRERAEKVIDDPYIISKRVIPLLTSFDTNKYPVSENTRKAIRITRRENDYKIEFELKNGDARHTSIFDHQLIFSPSRLTGCPKAYYVTRKRDSEVSGSYSLVSKILTDLHWRYKNAQAKEENETTREKYTTLADGLRKMTDEKGRLIEGINRTVSKICSTNAALQIDFLDIEQPFKYAFLASQKSTSILFPEQLGSGFHVLIAYALFEYVVNIEKEAIVLIIDEPELHLHSDWQKKMHQQFADQSGLQIVYSTQSENFVSLKHWESIRQVRETRILPKVDLLDRKDPNLMGYTLREFLNDYAKRNLHISTILKENHEMFFTKKCILVEGPAEKFAFPKLLKLEGCDLDKYSVSVIPVWGKQKIKIYQLICRAFEIDFFTVYDRDGTGTEDNMKENASIDKNALDDKRFSFTSSFESALGVGRDSKFMMVMEKIERTTNIGQVHEEIRNAVASLKKFVESN